MMKRWSILSVVAVGLLLAACDEEKTQADDTAAPDVADTTQPLPDVVPDTIEETTPDTVEADIPPDTAGKTTWDEVHTTFATKCAPCHAGISANDGAGGHAIASGDKQIAYDASQLSAGIAKCSGKKVGECAHIRILDGSMPQGANCGTTPQGAACVTPAQQALIQQWIQDGMLR